MATIVSIQQGGTGANNASDAVNALGTIANTGGIFTGEVQFKGQNNSINVANSAVISGNANISGNLRVTNQGFFGNGIAAHIAAKSIETNTIRVAGFANTNGASEIMVINKSNGSLAYAEFIALNDKANQEQGWISVGINSSEYNDPDFTLTGPDDGYLLFEPPLNSNANGDLIIGTGSNGLNNHIKLAAGGFSPTDAQMIISPADLKTAEITNSELISNVAILTTANTHTFIANDQVIIASVGAPYDGTFTILTVSSNTFTYAVTNSNLGPAAENGTATQYLPFNKGTVQLTAQLFVGENSKSTIETADITLAEGHAIPLGIVVDNDGPGQTVMFNKSNGTLAYSEFIAHNDAGNVEMGWISMGINSSGYDDPEYPITKADDAYLLYEPPANTSGDGDLIIGTGTNGTKNRIILAAEGFDEANAQVIITPNESVRIAINTDSTSANTGALQVEGGIGVQGSVYVQGNQTIQGDLIVNGTQTIQSIDSVAASGPLSILGDGNAANTWDFGVVGTYAVNREAATRTITNKALANNQATLTTSTNHTFNVEDYAVVTNVDSTFNGTHRITAVTSNTFTYFKLANNISSTAATGNVTVSSSARYTAVVKDTANATWKLLSNIEARPDFNVNLANTSLDNLQVATLNASTINVTTILSSVGANVANAVLKTGDTMTGVLNIANATALITTGNVGIGTNNPQYILHTNGGVVQFTRATKNLVLNPNYGASNTNADIQTDSGMALTFSPTGTEYMRITSSGNVGIGTTNPSSILDLYRSSNGPVVLAVRNPSTGSGAYSQIYFGNSTGVNGGGVALFGGGFASTSQYRANGVYIYSNQSGGLTLNAEGTNKLYLATNSTERIVILSDGSVGVGTTSPATALDVSGTIRSTTQTVPSSGSGLELIFSGGAGFLTSYNRSASEYLPVTITGSTVTLSNSGTSALFINSSGNIGIGTTNPYSYGTSRLTLYGTGSAGIVGYVYNSGATQSYLNFGNGTTGVTTNFSSATGGMLVGVDSDASSVIWTYQNTFMRFGTNGTERIRITSGGNVGIATTNPAVRLHVEGASIIATNTTIDPDDHPNRVFAGAISDSNWGVTTAIGGNSGTGDTWAIGHNGSSLYFGMGDGSTANSLATYMYFAANRNLHLVPDSGNVGVGTNVPSAKLHIIGGASQQLQIAGTEADFWLTSTGGGAGTWRILGSTGTTTKLFRIFDNDNSANRLVIDATGNVGISTTPYSALSITPPSAPSWGEGILINASSAGYSALFFRMEGASGSSYTGTWAFGKNASGQAGGELLQVVKNSLTGSALHRVDALQNWLTNGDSTFGYNVGIGTTSPEAKLDIVGSTVGGTQQSDWVSNGISYNSYVDLTVSRRHGATKNTVWGYTGPIIELRSSNAINEWTVAQIMGTVDPNNGSNHQGGLVFLTSPGGTTDPTGRRTAGAAPQVSMLIGSNGTMSVPNQPAFLVYSQGFSLSAGVWTQVSQYTTSVNYNISSSFNTSNGRFTAPVTGRYYFYAGGWATANSNNGDRYGMSATINGGSPFFITGANFSSVDSPLTGYGVVHNLSKGDYVELNAFSAIITQFGGGSHSFFFGGYLLG